jgi:hypothetical protein
LIIGIGGNDPNKTFQAYMIRVYSNDGKGVFQRTLMPGLTAIGNVSCIEELKVNSGGQRALFIGGRCVPGNYGLIPRNFLLLETSSGWQDITTQETGQIGMVTDAVGADLDGDGDDDLIVVGEWMLVTVFENTGQGFVYRGVVPGSHGLWQSAAMADVNGDGRPDIVAGNWGENSKLQASVNRPLELYVSDFDKNGNVTLSLQARSYSPGSRLTKIDFEESAVCFSEYGDAL